MVLFFHCSVMHFASDAKFGQPDSGWNVAAAIAGSLLLHLVLLRLHALSAHAAMLVVSVYLCFFHMGTLLVTLYEQRDVWRSRPWRTSGLAAANPRRAIAVAFGADAYDTRTGAARETRVLRIVSCRPFNAARKARGYVTPALLHKYFHQKLKLS